MDWVETTGKTVEEAQLRALAHLGVSVSDADIEVLEQPTTGLFGRVRGEARVRARIRPAGPRPKRTRRAAPRSEGRSSERSGDNRRREPAANGSSPSSDSSGDRPSREAGTASAPGQSRSARRRRNRSSGAGAVAGSSNHSQPQQREQRPNKEDNMAEGITLAEQAAIAKGFLEGLLQAMSLSAEVSTREIDAETVEVSINADPPTELGVLVGPRGTTLQALQEVTRTVVQSKSPARTDRILVDVAKYRERRVAALGRFAQQVAGEVTETGEERALEPMSAADRKAVHDSLTDHESVVTRSEGEEPRRFVVVAPA